MTDTEQKTSIQNRIATITAYLKNNAGQNPAKDSIYREERKNLEYVLDTITTRERAILAEENYQKHKAYHDELAKRLIDM